MTLPDTYAGGRFNLPIRVAKLVRKAESTTATERQAIIDRLWKIGYFLDFVDILWDRDAVPFIVRITDINYSRLAGLKGENSEN